MRETRYINGKAYMCTPGTICLLSPLDEHYYGSLANNNDSNCGEKEYHQQVETEDYIIAELEHSQLFLSII